MEVSPRQIRALAEFRHQIRRFLHFSEEAAKSAGVEPQQHQLMLAIKAMEPEPAGIAIPRGAPATAPSQRGGPGGPAGSKPGWSQGTRSATDRRSAQVALTAKGARILHALSLHHRRRAAIRDSGLIENLTLILHETESRHAKAQSAPRVSRERHESRNWETSPPRRACCGSPCWRSASE